MRFFQKIAENIDVSGVQAELKDHPEFWNADQERTKDVSSPHYDVDDIWLRYRPKPELTTTDAYKQPHFSSPYPAWWHMPSVRDISYQMMAKNRATNLGGVLMTRIKPSGLVKPHHDKGSWHSEYHNLKLYVGIKSNPGCVNFCGDESINIKEGEIWSFDNLVPHSVVNRGKTERITLIICLRVDE